MHKAQLHGTRSCQRAHAVFLLRERADLCRTLPIRATRHCRPRRQRDARPSRGCFRIAVVVSWPARIAVALLLKLRRCSGKTMHVAAQSLVALSWVRSRLGLQVQPELQSPAQKWNIISRGCSFSNRLVRVLLFMELRLKEKQSSLPEEMQLRRKSHCRGRQGTNIQHCFGQQHPLLAASLAACCYQPR